MLQATNIRVRSFDLSYLDIYWDVTDTAEQVLDYEFYIQRSTNETGPFVTIAGPIIDLFRFRDTTVRGQHSLYHKLFYRILVRNRETTATETFPENGLGARLAAPPDLHALEMSRQERVKLKEFKGRKVLVYPRRSSGTRCVACFDSVSRRRIIANCMTCYNTSYAGGYFAPIRTWMQIITPTTVSSKTATGEIQVQATNWLLSNYPLITEGDLVVEMENKRWTIAPQIQHVSKGRALVRQTGTLTQVHKNSAEYSVPVNMTVSEVGDIVASPERNYTNPHNVGDANIDAALKRLFGPSII